MRFQWPKSQGEIRDITKRQIEWLLEGLQIDQKKHILKELIHRT